MVIMYHSMYAEYDLENDLRYIGFWNHKKWNINKWLFTKEKKGD